MGINNDKVQALSGDKNTLVRTIRNEALNIVTNKGPGILIRLRFLVAGAA